MAASAADLSSLDRLIGRSVAGVGLVALVVVWFAAGRHLPKAAIIAFALVYGLGKLVVAVAGLARSWPVWPALLAEGLAMGLVALIVWTGTKEVAYLLLTAALLVGASFWRTRMARLTSGDL